MTNNNSDPSFQRLLSCLEQIRNTLDSGNDGFTSLSNLPLFSNTETPLKEPSDDLQVINSVSPCNSGVGIADIALQVIQLIKAETNSSPESKELAEILSNPLLTGLLTAYDGLASTDQVCVPNLISEPVAISSSPTHCNNLTSCEEEVVLDKEHQVVEDANTSSTTKLVELVKNGQEQLGVTIKYCEDREAVVVARILKGGTADKNGALCIGDEIVEIDGNITKGKTVDEVVSLMSAVKDTVRLKIVPVTEKKKQNQEKKILLRAQFDNNPEDDKFIPCPEVGLKFKKGDILRVLSKDDYNWWQAKKEDDVKIGIIPSKYFQERRHLFENLTEQQQLNGKRGLFYNLQMPKSKRRHSTPVGKDFHQEEILSYEEVKLAPPNKPRPVLLVGAPGVGRTELKRKLLAGNPEKYATPVPHTSRRMRPYETEGKEYHFVSRQTMESLIQKNKLVEFGKFNKCLYGTSLESVRKVTKMGKTGVLKVEPQALSMLRRPDIRPYTVFIKPPTIEKLRSSRNTHKPKSSIERRSVRTFKEEDLKEMIEVSTEMERLYGHLFDATIVNDDLQAAYSKLNGTIEKAQQEPQWIPLSWQF